MPPFPHSLSPCLSLATLTSKKEEAVPESLKNIILVMSSGGYLVAPTTDDGEGDDENQDPKKDRLWNETWKRLERFLPGLKGEVFPQQQAGKKTGVPIRAAVEKEQPATEEAAEEEEEAPAAA